MDDGEEDREEDIFESLNEPYGLSLPTTIPKHLHPNSLDNNQIRARFEQADEQNQAL